MHEVTRDERTADITADVTGAYLRARVVQQRVMWVCALGALIAVGVLATLVVTGQGGLRATEPGTPVHDGFRHIWSVSSVERRNGP